MKFSEKGLRIGFSLILLAFLFWYAQPLEAFAQLIRVAPLMIGISATGFGIIILLNALNGWWLLNGLVPIPFLKMLRYYLYSWVAEFYFPGKLGAFSIAYFLKKENVTVGQSTAIVMLTKLSTVTLAFGLGIAGLATWGWVGGLEHYLMIAGILIIVTFWTFFTKRGRDVVKRIILRHHTGLFIGFGGLVQRLGRNPLRLLVFIGLVGSGLLTQALVAHLLIGQAGFYIPLEVMVSIVSLVLLIGMVPLSFNGLGLREGLFVVLLEGFGVPGDIALAVGALNSGVGIALSFILTLLLLSRIPIPKWRDIVNENSTS